MNSPSTYGEALLRIAPADIYIPTRLGLYFPDKAAALGRLMAISGQRTPITVRAPATKEEKAAGQPWVLIAGRHRLGGAQIEELPFVLALERIGGTSADALDEEASENLDRREQPPLERAIFIFATCQAAKARLGQDINAQRLGAKARWDRVKARELRAEQALQDETDDACDTMSQACGWLDTVAEAFGRDKRSIHRALLLYRLIVEPFPDLTQRLSDHPVVGNNAAQLKAIADVKDDAQRRAVILQLLGNPELSADEARVAVGIDQVPSAATPVAHQKFFNQIEGGWQRLALPQRRQFIPTMVNMLHTPELKREMRDRLNEELGEKGTGSSGLKPAVQIRASVKPDYIVCLEDGTRHTNLTKRLVQLGMTPSEYRERWSLPTDYPMLAPNYTWKRTDAWRDRVRKARALAAKTAKQDTADAR